MLLRETRYEEEKSEWELYPMGIDQIMKSGCYQELALKCK